jgi:hypothetical protein
MLKYRLSYTTAFDVSEAFFRAFPWLNQTKKGVAEMILFALSLPKVGS